MSESVQAETKAPDIEGAKNSRVYNALLKELGLPREPMPHEHRTPTTFQIALLMMIRSLKSPNAKFSDLAADAHAGWDAAEWAREVRTRTAVLEKGFLHYSCEDLAAHLRGLVEAFYDSHFGFPLGKIASCNRDYETAHQKAAEMVHGLRIDCYAKILLELLFTAKNETLPSRVEKMRKLAEFEKEQVEQMAIVNPKDDPILLFLGMALRPLNVSKKTCSEAVGQIKVCLYDFERWLKKAQYQISPEEARWHIMMRERQLAESKTRNRKGKN